MTVLFRFILLAALAGTTPRAVSAATPPATTATTTNAPTATAPANPFPNAIPKGQIIGQAQALLQQYPPPATTPAPDPTETEVREKMEAKDAELQLFSDETKRLLTTNPSLERIHTLGNLGQYFSSLPAAWSSTLAARGDRLEKKIAQLDTVRAQWTDTQGALQAAPPLPAELEASIASAFNRIDAVRTALVARQGDLLRLEAQVTAKDTLVSDALARLAVARDRAISQLAIPSAPPVWDMATPTTPGAEEEITLERQVTVLRNYGATEPLRFVLHGLLLAALAGAFFRLRGYARQLVRKEPGIAPAAGIFETPLAMGLLLSLAAAPLLYYPLAPRLLSALLGAVALAPCVIILRRLIQPRLFPILYALVAFFFLEEFRAVAPFPPDGARALLLAEILGAAGFLAWLCLSGPRPGVRERFAKNVRYAARAALAVLAAGWLAEVLGYTLLANLLCVTLQRCATLALGLYAGIRIVEALLFILIRLRPISDLGMVRLQGRLLVRRARRLLVWMAGVFWVVFLLSQLPLPAGAFGRFAAFLGGYSPDKGFTFAPAGKVLGAVCVGWIVFQLSRFGRFVLETDFYPRLHLGAGVPYAISTTLHYAMLVVAFLAATSVLGIDMTKFTILVSALGVGVGFGLQNIINNFVSGLILLFERPVKLGDAVQVGDAIGTVERIGIRASVLRSSSGSELIIPNGSLISNNVTNWTLSGEERIVLIPFNVVRGPDTTHLITLLTEIAKAHPRVLKQPAPRVLAQTLGVNIGFELRAWIGTAEDWSPVRSDLVLALSAALARENVTLA